MYREPRSQSPPNRKITLYALHDPTHPLLKSKSSIHLIESQGSGTTPIKRHLKPVQQILHPPDERPRGLGRMYSPERPGSAMSSLLTLPEELLYPAVDKGRRLGKRHLADTTPRDPIKGINVISTDMFLKPQKMPVHTSSHIDLTDWASLEPNRSIHRVLPDPTAFDRACHTTREVYKTVVASREQVKQARITNTHDLLSWP